METEEEYFSSDDQEYFNCPKHQQVYTSTYYIITDRLLYCNIAFVVSRMYNEK